METAEEPQTRVSDPVSAHLRSKQTMSHHISVYCDRLHDRKCPRNVRQPDANANDGNENQLDLQEDHPPPIDAEAAHANPDRQTNSWAWVVFGLIILTAYTVAMVSSNGSLLLFSATQQPSLPPRMRVSRALQPVCLEANHFTSKVLKCASLPPYPPPQTYGNLAQQYRKAHPVLGRCKGAQVRTSPKL